MYCVNYCIELIVQFEYRKLYIIVINISNSIFVVVEVVVVAVVKCLFTNLVPLSFTGKYIKRSTILLFLYVSLILFSSRVRSICSFFLLMNRCNETIHFLLLRVPVIEAESLVRRELWSQETGQT